MIDVPRRMFMVCSRTTADCYVTEDRGVAQAALADGWDVYEFGKIGKLADKKGTTESVATNRSIVRS